MGFKHLPFQCACNPIVTISSYIAGNYDYYNVEQIEEFITWKGAVEIASLLEKYDDAPLMTHKCRGSQQSSRVNIAQFIDLTQGEPKNIYKP